MWHSRARAGGRTTPVLSPSSHRREQGMNSEQVCVCSMTAELNQSVLIYLLIESNGGRTNCF